jgi:hypothetical protein
MFGSICIRQYEEQEEKAGENGVILGERQEIYMFGRPTPTRLLEWLKYYDILLLVERLQELWVFE